MLRRGLIGLQQPEILRRDQRRWIVAPAEEIVRRAVKDFTEAVDGGTVDFMLTSFIS